MSVRIEPWDEDDRWLLDRLLGDPAMMEHLGGPEPEQDVLEFEYPPGHMMRCNDWRIDLAARRAA